MLQKSGVTHIDDSALSISRKKWGRGYIYMDENGSKVSDENLLKRLRSLVIPPMWSDVMVCKFDDGHIQAIGRDAKGRKQYIYHDKWEQIQQERKFERIAAFARALPAFRKHCISQVKSKKWTLDKVSALLVLVLDDCGIRIGNQQYASRNNTYGLSTMRRKHMSLEDGVLSFEFKGKSNKIRNVEIDEPELVEWIKRSADMPGFELFRYKDDDGTFRNIDSDDVNEFIHQHMGNEFSSKDFRTWVACRLAIEYYPASLQILENQPRRKFSNILLKMVAEELGNTPTVCKNYYVHPAILQRIEEKDIPTTSSSHDEDYSADMSVAEKIALDIIQST